MTSVKMNYHTHTTYSDGKNTPEEVVLAALSEGMTCLGFSDHSPISVPGGYGMPEDRVESYFREINALKEKYRGRIEILCGLEQDSLSPRPTLPFDYLIGSTHMIPGKGRMIEVDWSDAKVESAVKEDFGGDWYAYAEKYFEEEALVLDRTGADIIGHFDLVSIVNEGEKYFDFHHPRYIAAWRRAIDALIPFGKPFELNTGAIARGYRTEPYPSIEMIAYIREKGGRLILGSDSHRKDTLLFGFGDYGDLMSEEERTYSFHL